MNQSQSKRESLAPAVDRDLLRALVRKQLSQPEARNVYQLIYGFEEWNSAHQEILIDEQRNRSRSTTDVKPD